MWQHVELMPGRQQIVNHDLQMLLELFQLRNLFHPGNSSLRSLSSGLTASNKDMLNCDLVEEVVQTINIYSIQQVFSIVFKYFHGANIKRKDQVRKLALLEGGVDIEVKDQPITFVWPSDCTNLLIKVEEQKCQQFAYELTPEPRLLFVDGKKRQQQKSNLRNHLLPVSLREKGKPNADITVIDGGMLSYNIP